MWYCDAGAVIDGVVGLLFAHRAENPIAPRREVGGKKNCGTTSASCASVVVVLEPCLLVRAEVAAARPSVRYASVVNMRLSAWA